MNIVKLLAATFQRYPHLLAITLFFNFIYTILVNYYYFFILGGSSDHFFVNTLIIPYLYAALLYSILVYTHNLLGGRMVWIRYSEDPESNYFYFIVLPVFGPLFIGARIQKKLNELKLEMKKQNVTKLEDFRPLPRKSNNLL